MTPAGKFAKQIRDILLNARPGMQVGIFLPAGLSRKKARRIARSMAILHDKGRLK